jgi:hypothetical protein
MTNENKSDDEDYVEPCDIVLTNGISIVVESDMIVEVVPDKLAEQIATEKAKLAELEAQQAEEFPK